MSKPKRGRFNPVTKEEFDKIKKTLGLGLGYDEIAKLSGRHKTTVSRADRSKSYDEYKELVNSISREARSKAVVKTAKDKSDTIVKLDEILNALKVVNNKMAAIESKLDNQRRGFFGR